MEASSFNVRQFLAAVPPKWHDATLAVGSTVHDALDVQRVALHRDNNGRRVVVIYVKPIDLRRAAP